MNLETVVTLQTVARLLRYLAGKARAIRDELPKTDDLTFSRGHAEGRADTYELVAAWLDGIADGRIQP